MGNVESITALQASYKAALLDNDRARAVSVIEGAVASQADIVRLYLDVFQRTQREIGDLWMDGKIGVAQEHFCTAVTRHCMSILYPHVYSTGKNGRRFLALCVADELHDLGLQMVTDFLDHAGWETIYLGASVPADEIETVVQTHRPDVVGLSVSISSRLSYAEQAIHTIRARDDFSSVKILVGGHAFLGNPELWRGMGADGYGRDAAEALAIADAVTA